MSVNTRVLFGWAIGFACGVIATIAFALYRLPAPTVSQPQVAQGRPQLRSTPTKPPSRIPNVPPPNRNPYGRYNI